MGNSCRKGEGDHEFFQKLEHDRREGRALMRKLIEKSDEVDWDTLIQQADFLHHAEQKKLRQRERHWRKKQRKKAALRHKKYLAVGAFSVNLMAMRMQDDSTTGDESWQQESFKTSIEARTSTNSCSSSCGEIDHNTKYDISALGGCWNTTTHSSAIQF